jgi:protein-tyrosine-phosphatase
MSRLLFICSGNTCRSPMAAGIAQRVFGPSHTILSAGAETGGGFPPATKAITAMSEIGIDIANHRTVDVANLDLATFDLIIVFRPSPAESMSFPPSSRVEYLDISDPYGQSLDVYRMTARLIQRSVRALYAKDALYRISATGNATGSHAAGVFSRAAKEFEKEIRAFISRQSGIKVRTRAPLGELGRAIAVYGTSHNSPTLAAISETISEINDSWVKVKHLDDPAREDLVVGLLKIQHGFEQLN